jgi:hypothetical protein
MSLTYYIREESGRWAVTFDHIPSAFYFESREIALSVGRAAAAQHWADRRERTCVVIQRPGHEPRQDCCFEDRRSQPSAPGRADRRRMTPVGADDRLDSQELKSA